MVFIRFQFFYTFAPTNLVQIYKKLKQNPQAKTKVIIKMSSVPTRFSARIASRNKTRIPASRPRFSARIAARNKTRIPASQPTLKTKKNVSSFINFCHAKRDEVKAANPMSKLGDTGKLLAAMWKEMSESEKEIYAEP